MAEGYKTLRMDARVQAEYEEKRSRFIAQLCHVDSEREAQDFVGSVRAIHHDARHNVPAWILADGRMHTSDDGEPGRTAGMPTLEVLTAAGLKNVCCVTTRYFGGTLLGTGGLVRAYTEAARRAVARAGEEGLIAQVCLVTPVTCVVPYGAYEQVRRLVGLSHGKIRDSLFFEDVQLGCVFETGGEEGFLAAVQDLLGRDDACMVGEPRFEEF